MRAYAVNCFCEPVLPVERPDPQPTGTEVVIEVTRCGVCHTDIHIQDGYYDLGGGKRLNLKDRGITPPVIMGHEVLGRLVAKGPDAPIADSEVGKTFLVYPWLGCGQCDICLRGEENLCPKPSSIGVFRPGGYSEQCVVPHPKHLVDVTGIEPTLAATYACSGLTAYSALRKVSIDTDKDLLLLMGLGGVGLSGLQIARGLGYRNIVVADIDSGKRELAMARGARLAFDPSELIALVQSGKVKACRWKLYPSMASTTRWVACVPARCKAVWCSPGDETVAHPFKDIVMTASIRVPLVEPGTRPELAEIEASIMAERGEIAVLYKALLNSPPIASGWEKMLTAVRNRTTVPADLRELVILRVAVLNRASFEFEAHVPHAQRAGVTSQKIEAVRTLPSVGEVFTDDEKLVLELTDAMTRDVDVSHALMERVRTRFDPRGVVELVATVAAYNMVSRFLLALNITH